MANGFGALVSDVASATGAVLGDLIQTFAFLSSARSIAYLIPNCAVREVHRDELQLTLHPVITGTPITDHAFLMPQSVELYWGWSDSSAGFPGYVITVYQQLLGLQQSRQPLDISTGKRQYASMQIRSLQVVTDETSEFALIGVAICQQIIMTNAMGGGGPNTNGNQNIGGDNTITGATGAIDPRTGNFEAGVGTANASVQPPGGGVVYPTAPSDSGTKALGLPPGPPAPSFILTTPPPASP